MTARALFTTATALIASLTLSACDNTAPTSSPLTPGDQASFITHGTLDGNNHPAVVLIVMDIAEKPAFRCTGTLLSPVIVVTAGHCTGEPGEFSGMRVFTESDVEHGDNNYPFSGLNTIEAKAWHSHPNFTEALFALHDVGVIELASPMKLPAGAYGQLPEVNQLDALPSKSSTTFTSVGYGVQRINSAKLVEVLVRMNAEPRLIQINSPFTGSFSMLLSNNASTGGTCFGDSGGPNYLGSSNVIAGVTSFGLNGTCGGTGGVFRIDRQDVIAFVKGYLKG